MRTRNLLDTPQHSDPGSEAALGYDYQWHMAARKCIEMLADREVQYIVGEFHQDLISVRHGNQLDLIQVKKRDSGHWTLVSLTKPEHKQKQGTLGKLLQPIQDGKDVARLLLLGYGIVRDASPDGCSLSDLIALLQVPPDQRDLIWQEGIQSYTDYLVAELNKQGIERTTIAQGLSILTIDFTFPHPYAIEASNRDFLDQTLRDMWHIDLTTHEIADIYRDLYNRARAVSVQPKQPWRSKSIGRDEISNIVSARTKSYLPSGTRTELLTTQDKLTSVEMSDKVGYALQKRLDAMQLKYELSVGSAQWEGFRTQIDLRWREFRKQYPEIRGPILWQSLRNILAELGADWARQDSDSEVTLPKESSLT